MNANEPVLNENENTLAGGWGEAKKILCIRLDSMGDVLMTSPAMRALKRGRPDMKLALLTSEAGSRIASFIPQVDSTITYDPPWMKATASRPDSSQDHQMIARLRREKFDAAVIFTVFTQNPLPASLLAYLADIPLRLAYCRENPYQLLTHWAPETDLVVEANMRHEVRRHLDLVASVGFTTPDESLSLKLPRGTLDGLQAALPQLGLDLERPWVVIHPGASAPSRRYPAEGYAGVARILAGEHGWQVVFTGSSWERALVEETQAKMGLPSVSLVDKLDLGGLAGVLSLAPLLITNNTGPVHIAAAVGTPVVDLYALTNPQHTPWNVPSRVLSYDVPCRYCFKSVCPLGHQDCLRKIAPGEVVEAAIELLENPRTGPPGQNKNLEKAAQDK